MLSADCNSLLPPYLGLRGMRADAGLGGFRESLEHVLRQLRVCLNHLREY